MRATPTPIRLQKEIILLTQAILDLQHHLVLLPHIGSPTLISSATDSTSSKFELNFSQAHTSSTNDHETTDHSRNSLENAIQNIQIQPFSFSTIVNVRTTVDVCNLRKETLPIDIPRGPWKTDVGAKTDLEIWASNFMTGGGKFTNQLEWYLKFY